MNKDTIELERDKNHIYNYGLLVDKWENESLVLDEIIKWSQKCKDKKIYRHKIRIDQQNISNDRFYKPFNGERGYTPVPYCDRVVYLDIYWQ